jgi:hypothetical protein
MHSVAEEYMNQYLWPNGLGKFNITDPQYNDNGILINADFLDQLNRMGLNDEVEAYRDMFTSTVSALQHKDHQGLIHRTPDDIHRFDQQDNYLGMILGENILDINTITRKIYEYGTTHGFNYNNVHPDQWHVFCQRQPGEVAFYAIANGYMPEPSQFALFIAGITANAFFSPSASDSLLAHRRIVVVEKMGIKQPDFQNAFDTAKAIWFEKFKGRYKTMYELYLQFYRDYHPITKLAKEFDL